MTTTSYQLSIPYLNGYILDLNKSKKENIALLQRHCTKIERKYFFDSNKTNWLLKKFAKWEWIVLILAMILCIPLYQIYTGQASVDGVGMVIFHIPLFILPIKYVLIEFYVDYKASKSDSLKDLQQFYTEHWLELPLFPYLEKVASKIQKIRETNQQLSQQHLKTLTFTETPNTHQDLLIQAKGQLVHLEKVMTAYQKATIVFEQLEKEFFALKQSKDKEQLLGQSMQQISQQKIPKTKKGAYMKRFKQLKAFTKAANKLYYGCNTKPQESIQAYTQLLADITTYI